MTATQAEEAPAPRYASVAEAALYAQMSPRTIRRWADSGRLTKYRQGPKRVQVDLNELDQQRQLVRPREGLGTTEEKTA